MRHLVVAGSGRDSLQGGRTGSPGPRQDAANVRAGFQRLQVQLGAAEAGQPCGRQGAEQPALWPWPAESPRTSQHLRMDSSAWSKLEAAGTPPAAPRETSGSSCRGSALAEQAFGYSTDAQAAPSRACHQLVHTPLTVISQSWHRSMMLFLLIVSSLWQGVISSCNYHRCNVLGHAYDQAFSKVPQVPGSWPSSSSSQLADH